VLQTNDWEKDLTNLAFVGPSVALRDKMEGTDFLDINQVMQQALVHENWAKGQRVHGQYREMGTKDKPGVNCIDESSDIEEEMEVCITEWVESPKDKPLACSFLR
jgi:hypothetical protein